MSIRVITGDNSTGEYNCVLAVFDIPKEFNIDVEFREFLREKNLLGVKRGKSIPPIRSAVYSELTGGTKKPEVLFNEDLLIPWLRSLGFKSLDYEEYILD